MKTNPFDGMETPPIAEAIDLIRATIARGAPVAA